MGLGFPADVGFDFRLPDALEALAELRADDLEPEPGFRRELFLEAADFDLAFFFAIFCCLLVCTGSNSVVRIPELPQP